MHFDSGNGPPSSDSLSLLLLLMLQVGMATTETARRILETLDNMAKVRVLACICRRAQWLQGFTSTGVQGEHLLAATEYQPPAFFSHCCRPVIMPVTLPSPTPPRVGQAPQHLAKAAQAPHPMLGQVQPHLSSGSHLQLHPSQGSGVWEPSPLHLQAQGHHPHPRCCSLAQRRATPHTQVHPLLSWAAQHQCWGLRHRRSPSCLVGLLVQLAVQALLPPPLQ
jgi:hypothetical protein